MRNPVFQKWSFFIFLAVAFTCICAGPVEQRKMEPAYATLSPAASSVDMEQSNSSLSPGAPASKRFTGAFSFGPELLLISQ